MTSSSKIQDALNSALEGVELTMPSLGKAMAPTPKDFKDDTIKEEFEKLRIPQMSERTGLPDALRRFYHFYFTGLVPENDSVLALILEPIFFTKFHENSLLTWPQVGDDPFFERNTSTPSRTPITASSRVHNTYWSKTSGSMSEFQKLIFMEIDHIDPSKAADSRETQLTLLTSFLALTFLRAATKTAAQMTNAFMKKDYKENVKSVAKWQSTKFSPPCADAIATAASYLNKSNEGIPATFVVLVKTYLEYRQDNAPLVAFLSDSVLTHTARNGLGLIDLFEKARAILGISCTDLMKHSFVEPTVRAWTNLKKFYMDQLRSDNKQYAYQWARIINDAYFRGLSPKDELFLSFIFAGVIKCVHGNGIMRAEWAKRHCDRYDEMICYGEQLFIDFNPSVNKPDTAPTVAPRVL